MKSKQDAVVCTAEEVALDGVPEEIKLLPLGMVHNQKMDFKVDDESCEMIIRQFKGRRLDLVIDYEHQTLENIQAPAGGWIKDIWKGTDALVAKVEWTPKAKEYLLNKEYRYLSPVVMVRKNDRKAVSIHSVALTNTPAIDGMFAIVNSAGFPAEEIEKEKPNQGGNDMELLQKLAELLGLPAEATEEDIIKAIEALIKGTAKQEEEVVANSTILTMLGLKEDAKTEDVTGKIQQMQIGDSQVAIELAILKQSLARKDAQDAVGNALKTGKISSAQKEWAEEYALKDPAGFKNFCEKAVPIVPIGKLDITDSKTDGKALDVTPEVLKNMGLTKEDIEKFALKEE